ncbi:MAG: hypothetical protein ACXADA_07065 [Candidatus Hodarchaeales archaeon]|jgi:hypothetical protein
MQVIQKTDVINELEKEIDLKDPVSWLSRSYDDLLDLHGEVLEAIQLKWFNKRLSSLRDKIPALKTLAEKQGTIEAGELNDAAALLFTHKVYKSYPLNFIEKNKYQQLTAWLDKLTTVDLSIVDVKGIKSIDEWLDRLDENGMFIFHSTGTTGKLSFLPRSQHEKSAWEEAFFKFIEGMTNDPNIRNVRMPVFFPAYRTGRHIGARTLEHFGPLFAGSDDEYHALFDYPMSADFMSLAGRLRYAQSTGNLSKMEMIRAVVKSKGELIKMKKKRPQMVQDFFLNMVRNYKDQKVFLMAVTPDLLKVALEAREEGYNNVFDPKSVLITGGGMKGYDAPDNWEDILHEFYGVERIFIGYGMTEMMAHAPSCSARHYHFYPYLIPFVLDVDTGEVLPREGVQTGRMGFFDLLAETYWGGFLTGDKVTIHYEQCECGWKSPWVEDNIKRFSELQEDGEDKISCSGSQEAYNQFLDFIAEDVE